MDGETGRLVCSIWMKDGIYLILPVFALLYDSIFTFNVA